MKILIVLLSTTLFLMSCSSNTKIKINNKAKTLYIPKKIKAKPMLGPGLGKHFSIFNKVNNNAGLVIYISVDLSIIDNNPDYPIPSATRKAVHFVPCVVTISNSRTGFFETYQDTSVRYKGNSTFHKRKRQFKLKFHRKHRFHGLRRLNLHSNWKDATMIREKLAYDFFNAMGIIAPRANHVRIYLRNTNKKNSTFKYNGLYTAVEQVNKTFLAKRFGKKKNKGNLYKAYMGFAGIKQRWASLRYLGKNERNYRGGNAWAWKTQARAYRLKTNKKKYMENYSDLAKLITLINKSNNLKRDLPKVFNVDGFLKWLAGNSLVSGWDNYWFSIQNYYLYNVNNTRYWHWIPWDYDNSLGNNFLFKIGFDAERTNIFFKEYYKLVLVHKVLSVPKWKKKYCSYLRNFIKNYFNPKSMNKKIDALVKKITPYVLKDTLKQYSNQDWKKNLNYGMITHSDEDGTYFGRVKAHHSGLKKFVKERTKNVLQQLAHIK